MLRTQVGSRQGRSQVGRQENNAGKCRMSTEHDLAPSQSKTGGLYAALIGKSAAGAADWWAWLPGKQSGRGDTGGRLAAVTHVLNWLGFGHSRGNPCHKVQAENQWLAQHAPEKKMYGLMETLVDAHYRFHTSNEGKRMRSQSLDSISEESQAYDWIQAAYLGFCADHFSKLCLQPSGPQNLTYPV